MLKMHIKHRAIVLQKKPIFYRFIHHCVIAHKQNIETVVRLHCLNWEYAWQNSSVLTE